MCLKLLKKILFVLVLSGMVGSALAAPVEEDRIGHIRIVGNDTTRDYVILREMLVKPGDAIDLDKIEQSVQNIMNLGLFESVDYYLEQNSVDADTDLVIIVIERIYFFLLPTAKTNDNSQLEYGAKMIWYNVLGRNHTMKLKLLDAGATAGVNEYKSELKYVAPHPFGSPYQFELHIKQDVFVDDDPSFGLQSQLTREFSFDLVQWFNQEGVTSGLFAGVGLAYQSRYIDSLVDPSLSQGLNMATSFRYKMGYRDVHEHAFNRSGFSVTYLAQLATDSTGTPGSEFFLQLLDYRQYISLDRQSLKNLNFRILFGRSSNDVLGDKAFNLGGNTNLRGYEIGQFRGNGELIANIEYLSPLYGDPLIRKVFFIDAGEAVESLSELNFEDLNVGAGFGIRWKMKRFVHFNLRVDIAYGFELDEFRLALGAKHTF